MDELWTLWTVANYVLKIRKMLARRIFVRLRNTDACRCHYQCQKLNNVPRFSGLPDANNKFNIQIAYLMQKNMFVATLQRRNHINNISLFEPPALLNCSILIKYC